ncbi:BnaC01g20280D [Brassica napus]|uniref:BnaC01g20280D protein n=1 Tax=Brassica napus TaxID=3708 RepID=A0A078FXD8_BRANA|nr:BnaC01g20280D [Brassica napus]
MFSYVMSRSSRLPRGDYTAEDVGVKVDRPAVEELTEIIGG